MVQEKYTQEPTTEASPRAQGVRVGAHRFARRLALFGAVAGAAVWSTGSASAALIDEFARAPGTPNPTFTSQHSPTYDTPVDPDDADRAQLRCKRARGGHHC